jgi:hypothetical protein
MLVHALERLHHHRTLGGKDLVQFAK